MSSDFWAALDELVINHQVVIDRPLGSRHPRYPEMEYPLDYGYLKNTTSSDGEGIDLFKGSDQDQKVGALICAFDTQKKDAEIKLLLGCTPDEQRRALNFLNSRGLWVLLLPRDEEPTSWLLSRRSIRRFVNKSVPLDVINLLLEAAIQAPSAHNRQPARYVVIQGQGFKHHLAEAMGADFRKDLLQDGLLDEEVNTKVERSRQRITEAPTVILICLERASMDVYVDAPRQQAEYLMAVQGVAMAAENLLLAAHCVGLGGVWLCAPLFAPDAVRKALDLPYSWDPQGLVLLGYPANYPEKRLRRPLAEVVRYY